jgi:hypothetical protein
MKPALPGVLAEIASVAGEAAALAISARVGGTRVYIPAHAGDDHWLVDTVGREAADKITALLHGDRYEIPTLGVGAYRGFRMAIARRVHDLDKAGKSAPQIAREAGLTQRAVHRHRAAHRGGDKGGQGSLF